MKVVPLYGFHHAGSFVPAGQEVDLPDAMALNMVACGRARAAEERPAEQIAAEGALPVRRGPESDVEAAQSVPTDPQEHKSESAPQRPHRKRRA